MEGVVVKRFLGFLLFGFFAGTLFSCRTVDPAKKYPDMVANEDPISTGTIEVEFDKAFSSKAEKREVEVVFYPRYNTVALEFRHEFIKYRQIWNPEARRRFAEALDRYKADYAAKKLTGKFSRSRAAYGKFKGSAEWETFAITDTSFSYPVMELGYRFKGESPYFMVLQRSAREEYTANSDYPKPDSLQITIYYTRAQADELVKKFDQAYLMSLLSPKESPPDVPSQDEYDEGY
jgi:hypothetical protein